MATIFLWANIVICGFLTTSTWRQAGRSRRLRIRTLLVHIPPWQTLAAFVVLATDVSPWNLVWTLVVAAIVGFVLDQKMNPIALEYAAEDLDVEDRKDFVEFGNSRPALRKFFLDQSFDKDSVFPTPSRRLRVSLALGMLSENFKESGNYLNTLQCLRWALKFEPLNTAAWIGLAEIGLVLHDRCAGKWAYKFLSWKPDASTPDLLRKSYETLELGNSGIFDETKARMLEIMRICSQNPDWPDSSELSMPYGL